MNSGWKSFINEAKQDKKFIKKFNITVLQKNTPMPAEANPREYHQQIAQQAEEGPMFSKDILEIIENLEDRFFPRENRKVYTKWLANIVREHHGKVGGYLHYMKGPEGLPYIVDFLNGTRESTEPLWSLNWGGMKAAAEDWHEQFKGVEDTGHFESKNVLHDFGNGYTIVDVPSEDLAAEGNKMGHCVGGYCPEVEKGKIKIYSLRDRNNNPHVTIEYSLEGDGIYQIKGKENKAPHEKYAKMIYPWIIENFTAEEYAESDDFIAIIPTEEIKSFMRSGKLSLPRVARMARQDDELNSLIVDTMIKLKPVVQDNTLKQTITNLRYNSSFDDKHLLKLVDTIDETKADKKDLFILRLADWPSLPMDVLLRLFEKTKHYSESGLGGPSRQGHDLWRTMIKNLSERSDAPPEYLEQIYDIVHQLPNNAFGSRVRDRLLKNETTPDSVIKKHLSQFIVGKKLLYHADWNDWRGMDSEKRTDLYDKGDRAERTYRSLSSRENTDPRVLDLLLVTALEKDRALDDFFKKEKEELGDARIVQGSPLSIALREKTRSAAQWKIELFRNPSLSEANRKILTNNLAPYEIQLLAGSLESFKVSEDTAVRLLEKSLSDYIEYSKELANARTRKDRVGEKLSNYNLGALERVLQDILNRKTSRKKTEEFNDKLLAVSLDDSLWGRDPNHRDIKRQRRILKSFYNKNKNNIENFRNHYWPEEQEK